MRRKNKIKNSLQARLIRMLFLSVLFFPVYVRDADSEQIKAKTDSHDSVEEQSRGALAESWVISRNPFLFSREEEIKESRKVLAGSYLSAIFISSPKQSYAIIDGRIVKPGDTYQGKEITSITANEVGLKDINGEYVIYLYYR